MSIDCLRHLIATRTATIGLIGSGYSRLHLSRAFRAAGFQVLAFEIDTQDTMFPHLGSGQLPPGADQKNLAKASELEVVTDQQRLSELDVILLGTPFQLTTYSTHDPTLDKYFATMIATRIRSGQLVILTGFTAPGTTRAIVLPLLTTRFKSGQDFSLAYSPEPDDGPNGAALRVVGGYDASSLELASFLFEQLHTPVTRVSSLEAAEVCGIVGRVTRAVHTSVANEFRMVCDRMSANVWEVLDAVNPAGFPKLIPDLGDSDPAVLQFAWGVRKYGISARLVELVREMNSRMTGFILEKVANSLNSVGKSLRGSKILILGIGHKVLEDPRESHAFELMGLLLKKGAVITYNDPNFPNLPKISDWPDSSMTSALITHEFLAVQDCVLIAADQPTCDYNLIVAHSKLVVDTRNATRGVMANREKIILV